MFRHYHRPKTYAARAYFTIMVWWMDHGVNEWDARTSRVWRPK